MLTENPTAEGFRLLGTQGGREFQHYRLPDYTDSGAVILVSHPFDFSPICTSELCGFRDAEWLTMTEGVDGNPSIRVVADKPSELPAVDVEVEPP